MNTYKLPGKFYINFKALVSNESLFLFQIKNKEALESIICKICKDNKLILEYKNNKDEDKVVYLNFDILRESEHDIVFEFNKSINAEIDNFFVCSIGSIKMDFSNSILYSPMYGFQENLKIYKFEKIDD